MILLNESNKIIRFLKRVWSYWCLLGMALAHAHRTHLLLFLLSRRIMIKKKRILQIREYLFGT
jgi:hypothetical protein